VDVPHLERDAINELYIKKFKFFYYYWIQSSIIPKYSIGSHKKGRFLQAPRSHNLPYTPTAYIEIID
jgi:hypothetical protein